VAQAGASDEWVEIFCELVKDWKPREWAEEQGQIRAGVGPFLEPMQRERQAFVYRTRAFPTCAATRPCARNPSEGAWRLKGCTFRRMRRGARFARRVAVFSRPASMTTDLVGQLLDTMLSGIKSRQRSQRTRAAIAPTAITSAWMTGKHTDA
jgi:hypothetical protein